MALAALLLAGASGMVAGWLAHAAVHRRWLIAGRRDPVTGLATRAAWTHQARRILRRGSHLLLLIDLDLFKEVNDTYGHGVGDVVLAATAARIKSWADQTGGGACGRLGGDEFAVLTVRQVTAAEVGALVEALSAPVEVPAHGPVPVSASVGAAVTTSRDLSATLAAADAAMYAAKRDGGDCWRLAEDLPHPAAGPARSGRHHRLVG
jgi:diguanylate cyclase (GGDEF)-like protein